MHLAKSAPRHARAARSKSTHECAAPPDPTLFSSCTHAHPRQYTCGLDCASSRHTRAPHHAPRHGRFGWGREFVGPGLTR
eukprot:1346675-Prymnesium_polylepis.1